MDNVSKAVGLSERGAMYSQAVFAVFSEHFGVTEKQTLQIDACFGDYMSKAEILAEILGGGN